MFIQKVISVSRCVALGLPFVFATSGITVAGVTNGIALLEEGKIQEAVRAFQDGFENGEPDGVFYLGRMFELGLGTDVDMTRATQLYALGAQKNSPLAQNRLGLMFLEGQGVLKDYARGAELVCQSADAGDANAQFNCGMAYKDGTGVAVDPQKALSYWEKAGEQGHVAALNFAAQSYLSGDGVAVDPSKAAELFAATANQGNPMGLFELAKLNAEGESADLVKAYMYANLAASRGHPEAAAFRDTLEEKMTVDAVTQAQTAAREWKATPAEKG